MNFSAPIIVTAMVFLAGCQTSSYMSSAATDGDGVTCNEIYQAFDAYQRDRQSAQALTELSQLVSPTAGSIASSGVSSAERYYDQAKATANVALAVRNCAPIQ